MMTITAGRSNELMHRGSICFLLKPSECDTHEAIEILIDIASGEERVEPEWRSKVEVPGIDAVEKQINERRSASLS